MKKLLMIIWFMNEQDELFVLPPSRDIIKAIYSQADTENEEWSIETEILKALL